MSALEAARKGWHAGTAYRPMHTVMTLTEDGLVLGRGTVLAKTNCVDGRIRGLVLAGAEQRIPALLSVAYGKSVEGCVIEKVKLASDYWGRGETTLALIALAQTGLPRLPDPEEAAFRLFLADRALADGVSPDELIEACSLATGPRDLDKAGYNPNQPRVPAGDPQGGQWTAEDASPVGDTQLAPADTGAVLVNYKVIKEPPSNAKVVIPQDGKPIIAGDPPTLLLAPPHAGFRQVYAAGRAIASLPIPDQILHIRAALHHGGTYDFQRDPIRQEMQPAYVHASNYAVGVYMAGAGYSLWGTQHIAEAYALFNSSNYGSQDQKDWTTAGWNDATAGRWK